MEKLIVKNFLTIRHAEIEVRRMNIIIGPQASGKSVIAKLLYFFKKELNEAFYESIRKQEGKRQLDSALVSKFEVIFPKSYWSHQEFEIVYEYDDLTVTLKNHKRTARPALSLSYSKWLIQFQTKAKKHCISSIEYAQKNQDESAESYEKDEDFIIYRSAHEFIINSEQSKYFKNHIFIPASRTFFASLQKNIFSFLASNIDIDYFLKEFGYVYERSKRYYTFAQTLARRDESYEKAKEFIESIIMGKYFYENQQDWITSHQGRVNLANASSGQQESLPMLLVLLTTPLFASKDGFGLFIEEPEAHLFPTAQKLVVSLLALIANQTNHQFFITTHSPYILTALNNCILAHSTYQAVDEEGKKRVAETVPENQHIAFSDVGAWTITEKGDLMSILDQENQIIGASILDEVSDHFENITNTLLDIRYGE
jgi:predicted ATPase